MFRRRAIELDEYQMELLDYVSRCLPIAKKHVLDFAKVGAAEAEAMMPENIVTFNRHPRPNPDTPSNE